RRHRPPAGGYWRSPLYSALLNYRNGLTRQNESGSNTLCLDVADSRAGILSTDTERPSPRYSGIDVWEPADVLEAMIEGQLAAVAAVRTARPQLEAALHGMEDRLRQPG